MYRAHLSRLRETPFHGPRHHPLPPSLSTSTVDITRSNSATIAHRAANSGQTKGPRSRGRALLSNYRPWRQSRGAGLHPPRGAAPRPPQTGRSATTAELELASTMPARGEGGGEGEKPATVPCAAGLPLGAGTPSLTHSLPLLTPPSDGLPLAVAATVPGCQGFVLCVPLPRPA